MQASTERVAGHLRAMIAAGQLRPGQQLSQQLLAESLGVSRIPLREALRTLAGEGLIELRRGQGAQVAELQVPDLIDLYRVRLAIEPLAAADVVLRTSPGALRALRHRLERMRAETDADVRSRHHFRFHRDLYAVVARRHWSKVIDQVLTLIEPYAKRYVGPSDEQLGPAGDAHDAMLDAIERGDSEQLSRAIRQHLELPYQTLLATAMNADSDREYPRERLRADVLHATA